MDDILMLAFCQFQEGYYVSNDRKMCEHVKNNTVESRAWCHSHRIEFRFDQDGLFIPKSQPIQNNTDIEEMDLCATNEEVRI